MPIGCSRERRDEADNMQQTNLAEEVGVPVILSYESGFLRHLLANKPKYKSTDSEVQSHAAFRPVHTQ